MDGARNVNSAIHFIRIPWIIRSDNDENMKYFTKRSLKFFPRYWLSMVTIPAGSTNSWSSLSFLEITSPTVILNRFQHAPESSLKGGKIFIIHSKRHVIQAPKTGDGIKQIKLRAVFHSERTSHPFNNDSNGCNQLSISTSDVIS